MQRGGLFNSAFYDYSGPVDNVKDIIALKAGLDRPVVLVGLMGSGKTTLGRALAQALGVGFVDADDVIVKRAGKKIPAIFAEDGEPRFRAIERESIAALIEEGKAGVISTGGGAFINEETRRLILDRGISLWLKADLKTLAKRTAGDRGRQLLKNGYPVGTLSALMDTRYPVYAEADITVETGLEPVEQTLDKVIDVLCQHTGCR